MADLIDRNASIRFISNIERDDEDRLFTFEELKKMLRDAPAVNRWISVEDVLPENNEIVFVCLYWEKEAYVRKGYIKNEVWYTTDGYRMCIIPRFWMHEYIPEPPKENE